MHYLLIALFLMVARPSDARTIEQAVEPRGLVVWLHGRIDFQTVRKFDEIIYEHIEHLVKTKRLMLVADSNGGGLLAASSIADLIKGLEESEGIVTEITVADRCWSACVLILSAAKMRFMGARATIGFHGITSMRSDVSEEEMVSARKRYVDAIRARSAAMADYVEANGLLLDASRSVKLNREQIEAIAPEFINPSTDGSAAR